MLIHGVLSIMHMGNNNDFYDGLREKKPLVLLRKIISRDVQLIFFKKSFVFKSFTGHIGAHILETSFVTFFFFFTSVILVFYGGLKEGHPYSSSYESF